MTLFLRYSITIKQISIVTVQVIHNSIVYLAYIQHVCNAENCHSLNCMFELNYSALNDVPVSETFLTGVLQNISRTIKHS